MKRKLALLTILMIALQAANLVANNNTNSVTVIVSRCAHLPAQSFTVGWKNNLTALEALQHVAEVSTRPRGQFVFVNKVNGLQNDPGNKAWYYTVNGNPTGIISINYAVNPGDTIKWRFRDDICTPR